jgi:thioredoxin 1
VGISLFEGVSVIMAKPMTVTDQEFAQVVLQADELVLVDFWATYCAACRMVAPVVDELATDYAGKAAIVKVNVDENPEYATQYQVRSTPTLLLACNTSVSLYLRSICVSSTSLARVASGRKMRYDSGNTIRGAL